MKYDEVAAHPFLLTAPWQRSACQNFGLAGRLHTAAGRRGAVPGARPREHRGPTRPRAPASGRLKARKGFLSRSFVSPELHAARAHFFWRFHLSVITAKFAIATPSFARRDVTVVTVVHRSLAWTVRQRQMLSANPCMLTVCSLPRMQVSLQCARQHSKRAAR